MTDASSNVVVIVLNWNGWNDTIECLESLFRSHYRNFRVLVCDNGSSDGSLERIRNWARGELDQEKLRDVSAGRDQVLSPVVKPIVCSEYSRSAAERGGATSDIRTPLLLVDTGANLGYAGGNNVGLRYCLARADVDYIWILNNDTVVHADAMGELVATLQADAYQRPAGSRIYDYARPEVLHTWGGQILGRLGVVAPRYTDRAENIDYLMGASLFMSSSRLRSLGLLNENYFLNAEDLEYTYDFGRRFVREHPDELPFNVAGTVWHKESVAQSRDSFLHAYYFTRNVLHAAARLGQIYRMLTLLYTLLRIVKTALGGRSHYLRGMLTGIGHHVRGVWGPYPGADRRETG